MAKNEKQRNVTLEQLARMVEKGFANVDKRFSQVDKRFAQSEKTMATKADLKQFATKHELDQLALMTAKGFAGVDNRFEDLRTEMNAGFGYINITLDKHMGNVRKQTDNLARRVKRLEEAVFKD